MKIPGDSKEEAIRHTGKRVSWKLSKRITQQPKREKHKGSFQKKCFNN
jgi:hypothetical protein